MPIENKILRNGRVLVNVYTDPLNFVELAHHIAHVNKAFLDTATKPVHIIADLTAITQVPSQILSGSRQMTRAIHPMSGSAPLVMPNMPMMMIGETIRRLTPRVKIIVFRTLDEALNYVDGLLEKEAEEVRKGPDAPIDPPSVPS